MFADPEPKTPFVKVCGLTRPGDVRFCALHGADAVGLVRHTPSPRHLGDDAIVDLARVAVDAGTRPVLVAVDLSRGTAERLIAAAGLAAVQLCGDEDPEEWNGLSVPILRRVSVDGSGAAEIERWRSLASAFVLDAPGAAGGTGRTVDPNVAADLAAEAPALLAGGLDEAGVAALPRTLLARLHGFDASSRLELRPGVKCPESVAAFAEAARRNSARTNTATPPTDARR